MSATNGKEENNEIIKSNRIQIPPNNFSNVSNFTNLSNINNVNNINKTMEEIQTKGMYSNRKLYGTNKSIMNIINYKSKDLNCISNLNSNSNANFDLKVISNLIQSENNFSSTQRDSIENNKKLFSNENYNKTIKQSIGQNSITKSNQSTKEIFHYIGKLSEQLTNLQQIIETNFQKQEFVQHHLLDYIAVDNLI